MRTEPPGSRSLTLKWLRAAARAALSGPEGHFGTEWTSGDSTGFTTPRHPLPQSFDLPWAGGLAWYAWSELPSRPPDAPPI